MLSGLDIDVITFSETWLRPHLSMNTVGLDGFKAFRQDREHGPGKNKRGCVLITYISDKHAMNSEVCEELNTSNLWSNEHIEALWTRIHRPHCKDMLVLNLYRPPYGDLPKAIASRNKALNSVNLTKLDVFLHGDMNVNYKNKESPNFKKFNFFAQSNSLTLKLPQGIQTKLTPLLI